MFLRLLAMFVFYAMVLFAAQLQVDEPPGPGCCPPGVPVITGTNFTFSAVENLSGCLWNGVQVAPCQFGNLSGEDWVLLRIEISPGSQGVDCSIRRLFSSCVTEQGTPELPAILRLSGGTGVPDGEVIRLSATGWTLGTTFEVFANDITNIPEPAYGSLALLSLAVMAALRRRQQ